MGYIDTSVLVAYYCPEPLSDEVQRTLAEIAQPVISPLVELEFHSALAMKVRVGGITEADAGRVLSMFQLHLSERRYRVVPIGASEFTQARNWLDTSAAPLRTLDALHLAAAFTNGVPLVTSDQALLVAAHTLGIDHHPVG